MLKGDHLRLKIAKPHRFIASYTAGERCSGPYMVLHARAYETQYLEKFLVPTTSPHVG